MSSIFNSRSLLCLLSSPLTQPKPISLIPESPGSVSGQLPFPSYSTQSSKQLPEYEMPTVTWGIVQGRKEKLVSEVIVFDYLKGLGIVTDELEAVELPSTVDVMRERVEFLQKLGLTIDDINSTH
ncbi:hypothetical protein Droror1_Dr00024683 [Drosera rotundifolia]